MSLIRTLGKALLVLGIAGFIGATLWWYMFFESFMGSKVKEASECFYQTTTGCEAGNLIGVLGDVPVYSPMALWIATAAFCLGSLMYGLSVKKPEQYSEA